MLGTWVLPRALLSECGVRYETWVLMSLQGVAARVWALGFDGGYVYAGAKKASAFAIWAYAGVVCTNRGISLPNQYGKMCSLNSQAADFQKKRLCAATDASSFGIVSNRTKGCSRQGSNMFSSPGLNSEHYSNIFEQRIATAVRSPMSEADFFPLVLWIEYATTSSYQL